MRVDLDASRSEGSDHYRIHWSTARSTGSGRLDHVRGSSPEWLGSAEELLEGATRREERAVVDALAAWALEQDIEVGLWWDDRGVETLHTPTR